MQNFYTTTGRPKLASYIAVMDGFIFVSCFALLFALIGGDLLWLCYACSGAATFAVVLLLGKNIRKKEQVDGMLLLREQNEPGAALDVTIGATPGQATGLSGQVIGFCAQNGVDPLTANRLGVAVEEMAVNTACIAHKQKEPGVIDILVRVTDDKLIVRFRDDGAIFDPSAYRPDGENGCVTDGIGVMKKLANGIDYVRQLGFNTTVLTFDRN